MNPVLPQNSQLFVEHYRDILNQDERSEILFFREVYYVPKTFFDADYKDRVSLNANSDDDRFASVSSEHIAYRYEILKELGSGTFGNVFLALDHKTQQMVAVKVGRSSRHYQQVNIEEVKALAYLQSQQIEGVINHNVQMIHNFVFHSHVCIVFELLTGPNLHSAMKQQDQSRFSIERICKITRDILKCLSFLHSTPESIVHCDLKPENIVFRDDGDDSDAVVVDFGYACSSRKIKYTRVQTTIYRAPEVMIEARFGVAIDMWSLGCIVAELFTGKPLFNGRFANLSRDWSF